MFAFKLWNIFYSYQYLSLIQFHIELNWQHMRVAPRDAPILLIQQILFLQYIE